MNPHYLITIFTIYSSLQTYDAIDCNEVIDRGQDWVNRRIPYSMEASTSAPGGGQYRTDCSGYVSMVWKLPFSRSTVTLPEVARLISKNELRKGDIMMKGGPGSAGANGHVALFEKWANDEQSSYWGYEQTTPHTLHRVIPYPYFGGGGYLPYRYNSISCDSSGPPPPSGDCRCCKGNALGEFCRHELCGNCIQTDIYGCNKRDAPPSIHYGVCKKGCTGSDNSRAHCNK